MKGKHARVHNVYVSSKQLQAPIVKPNQLVCGGYVQIQANPYMYNYACTCKHIHFNVLPARERGGSFLLFAYLTEHPTLNTHTYWLVIVLFGVAYSYLISLVIIGSVICEVFTGI